jgi:hypothetical protein
MRKWMLLGAVLLLVGALVWALSGSGHDPNHGIDMEKARAAADRVHPPPPPGTKRIPGFGG